MDDLIVSVQVRPRRRRGNEADVVIDEELLAQISRGESQRTEFKAAEADAAAIGRAIVAMANSGGGSVFLGVGDRGELWGLWYGQPDHIARHIRTMPDLASWR